MKYWYHFLKRVGPFFKKGEKGGGGMGIQEKDGGREKNKIYINNILTFSLHWQIMHSMSASSFLLSCIFTWCCRKTSMKKNIIFNPTLTKNIWQIYVTFNAPINQLFVLMHFLKLSLRGEELSTGSAANKMATAHQLLTTLSSGGRSRRSERSAGSRQSARTAGGSSSLKSVSRTYCSVPTFNFSNIIYI